MPTKLIRYTCHVTMELNLHVEPYQSLCCGNYVSRAAHDKIVTSKMVAMGAALLGVVVEGESFTALNSSLFLAIALSRPPLYCTSA